MGGRGSSFGVIMSGGRAPEPIDRELFQSDSETDRKTNIVNVVKKKYNIVTMRSTDEIDSNYLDKNIMEIDSVLEKVNNSYNISFRHLIGTASKNRLSLRADKLRANTIAVSMLEQVRIGNRITYRSHIIYNKNTYKGDAAENKMYEMQKRSIEYGHAVKVPKDKYSVYATVHELGHAFQQSLFRQKEGKDSLTEYEHFSNKMKNDIIEIGKRDFNLKNEYSSNYAKENSREWFAETFTDLMLNGNHTPLTKAIDKYLKEVDL